jgi:hypothetical protein
MSKLKAVVNSAWVNLACCIILLISAGNEILKDIDGGIGAHHGVALFALFKILQILPDIVEHAAKASEDVSEIEKERP